MKLKDKKIRIYASELRQTEDDWNPVAFWKPISPRSLWAYVRQVSQKEYHAAMAVQSEEDMLFMVNWRTIDVAMMVLYKETWYRITRIDTFEGYKADLVLYAVEAKSGEIPESDKILPYDG